MQFQTNKDKIQGSLVILTPAFYAAYATHGTERNRFNTNRPRLYLTSRYVIMSAVFV